MLFRLIGNFTGWVLLFGFLSLGVLPGMAQRTSEPQDFFLEASVNNDAPYRGEAIIYTVRIYLAGILRESPTYRPPEFTDVWIADTIPGRTTRETVQGRAYDMTVIQNVLYPISAGVVTIPPAAINFSLDDTGAVVIPSNPVVLQVQPLPPDAPQGFNGAVGEYTVAASLDQTTVQVGEALTLTLRVAGEGNLEQIASPPLTLPPEWRAYAQQPQFQRSAFSRTTNKTFRWLLIPTTPGTKTLNALSWVYFDTAEERYRHVSADPLTVTVTGEALDIEPLADGNRLALKPAPAALNLGASTVDDGFWLLWLLPLVLLLLVMIVRLSERLQIADEQRNRQKKAFRIAERQLKAAKKQDERLFREVEAIVVGYFANRMGRDYLSVGQVPVLAGEQQLPEDLTRELLACVEVAQAAEFAPPGMYRPGTLYSRTRSALRKLDKVWKRPIV